MADVLQAHITSRGRAWVTRVTGHRDVAVHGKDVDVMTSIMVSVSGRNVTMVMVIVAVVSVVMIVTLIISMRPAAPSYRNP